jgi:hypothetical protein
MDQFSPAEETGKRGKALPALSGGLSKKKKVRTNPSRIQFQ